jgi:hypothetical protein
VVALVSEGGLDCLHEIVAFGSSPTCRVVPVWTRRKSSAGTAIKDHTAIAAETGVVEILGIGHRITEVIEKRVR